MTAPRTFTSPEGRVDRRAEFVDFYKSTYPAVTGELLALTGDVDVAHAVAGASYARAWQAWPSVRTLDWPAMWVRVDAVRRTRRPPRGDGILQHGLPALPEVTLDPEDEVLVAGLQHLPAVDRVPLVLHYLGHVPVEAIAEWFGEQHDEVEAQLDRGFDALVGILDWPDDEGASAGQGDAYDWTAEALEDCARRFGETIPVPPPKLVFRRGTVTKVTRRGAPVTAAATAAVIGLVAYLSPAPERTAQAAMYAAPPPAIAQGTPAGPDPAIPEIPASAAASPAGTRTTSVAHRVAKKKTTTKTTGTVLAGVPAVTSGSPVVTTSTTPTSPAPTSTTPTSTTPTTTTAAGGGTGSDALAASGSTGTGSTGSSVVTTTGSTTPDTSAGETTTDETSTDETTTDETTTPTTTRHRPPDQDGDPPTTTSTTVTSVPVTSIPVTSTTVTSPIVTSPTQTSTTQTSTTQTTAGTKSVAGTTLTATVTVGKSSSE